jgi:hypothetical protein
MTSSGSLLKAEPLNSCVMSQHCRAWGWSAQHAFCSLAILILAVAVNAVAGPVYPLKKSGNGRFLVDQNSTPYLITGDSPQALIVNMSEAEAQTFFADRSARGFNTLWINLLCTTYTGGRPDASTVDGILPFTNKISASSYDLATPNEAYFAHVDRIISLASQYGLQVMLDPIETGGFLSTMLDNGTNKCRAYGQYLGSRYKSFPNLVWMSGNDFQGWRVLSNDAVALAVARGLQDTDTNHIYTVQFDYPVSSSLDDTNWTANITLNGTYTYFPTYAQSLTDYSRTNFLPNFMVEANYEFEDNLGHLGILTPQILRRQEYWAMLSGAAGQLYGNHYTWQLINGWQTNLNTPGTIQFGYVKALFESRAWYNLIPDTNHLVVTSGYGTFTTSGSVNDSDYATAARTSDGTLIVAYMPTTRTLTMDMSKLSGAGLARWYDPAQGTYIQVPGSPFANTGTRDFTPPGNNGDGQGDWILVLEDPPGPIMGIRLAGPGTNGVVVSFSSVAGKLYDLQIATNLTHVAWFPFATNILGTGAILQIADTNMSGQLMRFYRVKTLGNWLGTVLGIRMAGPGANHVVVSFNTVLGKLYELQSTTNLASGVWLSLATNIPGTGGIIQITDTRPASQPARFYRTRSAN